MTIEAPRRVTDLRRAVTVLARERGITERRLVSLVANVTLAQMLPESAVKGGTGLKLRLGESLTRETPDLDTAFRGDLDHFQRRLTVQLSDGWAGFTGTVVRGERRAPGSVPAGYAMQPFRVSLRYAGKTFKAVDLEVGYDELEATTREAPEHEISDEVRSVFAALGLPEPGAVRVQPLHHQIAQKLHACTAPGSDRAHDLVDLQLIVPLVDDVAVASTARRLFAFRAEHEWPPTAVPGTRWDDAYRTASEGLSVLPTVAEAVEWLNLYIRELDSGPVG